MYKFCFLKACCPSKAAALVTERRVGTAPQIGFAAGASDAHSWGFDVYRVCIN